jgi:hypothetical protein
MGRSRLPLVKRSWLVDIHQTIQREVSLMDEPAHPIPMQVSSTRRQIQKIEEILVHGNLSFPVIFVKSLHVPVAQTGSFFFGHQRTWCGRLSRRAQTRQEHELII